MPDVYSKGQPHVPVADIGGHYVGMHAPERPEVFKPEKLWWRGDEVDMLRAEVAELKRARALSAEASATMRDESIAKSEVIKELEERARLLKDQVADLILHVQECETRGARRPPKRAGRPP